MKKNLFDIVITSALNFVFLYFLVFFVNCTEAKGLYTQGNFSPLCIFGEFLYLIAYTLIFRKKICMDATTEESFNAKKQFIDYYYDFGKYHLIIFVTCSLLTTLSSLIKPISSLGIIGFLFMPMAGVLGSAHVLGGLIGLVSHIILMPIVALGIKYSHFVSNRNIEK